MRSITLGTIALLLSTSLGSAHASAQVVTNTTTVSALQLDPALATLRARRRAAPRRVRPFVGEAAVGMALGASGVIGGVILALVGATRGHTCSGFLYGGVSCYDALPDDTDMITGGIVSAVVGGLAVLTGAVLLAQRRPAFHVGAVALRDGAFLAIGGEL